MTRYNKGANAERELLQTLYEAGMAVCRAAGSGKGKDTIPTPDAIALRKGKIYAFECKAWKAGNLSISTQQMKDLEKWCALAGAELVIAWKIPRKGWRFLKKEHFKENEKSYGISTQNAHTRGKRIEYFSAEPLQLEGKTLLLK
ncbi:MAG: Holliday junction resolvase Hjc [Candidatus Diapherotrites archaeon]